jgi:hypothetical protein
MVMYNLDADGHYVSKKEGRKAGLPIIQKFTIRVDIANGGVGQAKIVMQLLF